jgi:hypothetical protein
MSLFVYIDDACPKCRTKIHHSVIDPHPTNRDLAIHKFECVDCGVVKTKIISIKPQKKSAGIAA